MTTKLHLLLAFTLIYGKFTHADEIYEAKGGSITLSEKSESGGWLKATYKNESYSFVFPTEGDYMHFTASESKFSRNRGYFILATDIEDVRGQNCYYIEMKTGCVVYSDFCQTYWSKDIEDGIMVWSDATDQFELKNISEFDRRLSAHVNEDDYLSLRDENKENGKEPSPEYLEKICGLSIDPQGKVTFNYNQKKSPPAQSRVNLNEILETCKVKCRIEELEAINIDISNTLTKGQIPIYNDIAFYMERNSLYTNAIAILKKVISSDPNRIPAYLNIADAYWNNNQHIEAITNYRIYSEKMKIAGKATKIPKRVFDRLNIN